MPDDHPQYRLGKLEPRHDPRTLLLADFLEPELPAVPPSISYSHYVNDWPLYANDRVSDCTIAARAHMVELWSAMGAPPVVPDEPEVLATYERLTGGPDTGLVELDVLNDWRRNGTGGQTIYAFVAVDPANLDHVKHAAALFGGLYLGLALPNTARGQIEAGQPWDVPSGGLTGDGAPASWGRHAVNLADYDADGVTVVTWGRLQHMTWAYWQAATAEDRYVDECWAVLPQAWQTGAPASIGGLDFQRLSDALQQLKTG